MKILEVVPGTSMFDVLTRDYPDGRNLQVKIPSDSATCR